ncbi:hypothetical protein [Paraburkholderia sp. Cpub6]|uniref:hypothetical protein n=1 Tax=Paraburkholderia sp. Cpub6 TaxID=2723094 RepID=UPI001609EFCC|nr:hypothetical protein [Paraburkholderia sp. Cpub6]MBB5460298.1 hypothetical protein [Paraburkholderia sp. Cpub6]
MHSTGGRLGYRLLKKLLVATALSALLAIAMTWAGSIYDNPADASIMVGMAAPECAEVRDMTAGSPGLAAQPQSEVCQTFFVYRISAPDAANDPDSYRASIVQHRTDEFSQVVPYAWLLCFTVVGIAMTLMYVFRAGLRWHRRSA